MPAELSLPDRYHLMGHVASGGMAAVYAARDELLGREVAVKVLAEHLNLDPGAKLRFQREARAAAGLSSHPHVVTIYDVGEHAGRSFIVMELLRRGSLAQVLRSGRDVADRPTAVGWLRDAASALDAAHAAGIVHRDVKPANLLLDDRGGMVMADFGIARIAQEDQLTQTGQVLGTAAYLSPEQALGEPATAASDRYALAVVAFELLTGRRPFTAEHFAAQARAHIEDPPPRAGDIRPDLPPGVEAVLERGLAKAPEDRWPTAGAFVDALDEALAEPEEEPTRAMAPLPPPRAEPVTPEPRPVLRQSPRRERSFVAAEAPQQPRRGPGRWVALLAVLLALVAGGVAIAALSGEGDAKRDS
ncbi:MAG: serine/threonine protein kinase, partial [Solirubrobacterales bacterium]|nr:serine/threonine protein kinase [Solirubrobacterales bacterium]